MSAYVVSKGHIDALVQAGISPRERMRWHHPRPGATSTIEDWQEATHELGRDTADEVGAMLWGENVRSVRHRYPDDNGNSLPGPITFTPGDADAYHLPFDARTYNPVAILKAIDGCGATGPLVAVMREQEVNATCTVTGVIMDARIELVTPEEEKP